MKSMTENVVECVNAILKTLECSICLELLKNPISTGCGHFFCRFCITETLQSNYRAPCPLCKKSFTRRGIQDAHQRKSILVAAKKLADICETFADVKFFNKDLSQRKVEEDTIMPTLTSFENQSNATETATRTSLGRKRKSNDKEEDAVLKERNNPLPVLQKIGTDIEPPQVDSSGDEAIPISNKRYCQSVEDSDSDGLPELSTIFQKWIQPKVSDVHSSAIKDNPIPPIPQVDSSGNEAIPISNKHYCQSVEDSDSDGLPELSTIFPKWRQPKVSDVHSSAIKDSPIPPTVVTTKPLDFEANKNLNSVQDINSISSASKTNIKDSTSMSLQKNESDISYADESCKLQIKTRESNCLKIVRKRRFGAQNPKEKKKSNALRNKTNELNIDDTTNNSINLALNVIEEAGKNINSPVIEKIDEIKDIKENNQTKDVNVSSSPLKDNCNKSNLKSLRSPKKSTKTPKLKKKVVASSSEEEEKLIAKLTDAENFELTISKNMIPSTVVINNSKECYSLNEINLPKLKENAKIIDDVKRAAQTDDIADTAIFVQTVASPEISKTDLASRSPGWSKVKQVGKDFRVKKFSKLSVEKNSSHSCPTEITSTEQTKSNASSSESPKFKKLPNCNVTKDIHNEGITKNSDATKISKNSLLENEVLVDKQSTNCYEQMSDGAEIIEKTTVFSELEKSDHIVAKMSGKMESQNEINLSSAGSGNCVALDEYRENNKNRENNFITNDCSLLEDNLVSAIPVSNHILPNFQLSSISDGRNENFKSVQNNILNSGMDYEGDDIGNHVEESMEVDNFIADDEHSKRPENEASYIDVFEKEIPIKTLSHANLCNEINNRSEININKNFQGHCNNIELCNVDSVLSNEKSFPKPDFKILANADIIKENKLLSKISKISKCEITASKSIFDKDENVYYTEHSQQTSQRLLEFCNNGPKKPSSFSGDVAALDVPFYYAPNMHGIVSNRNWCNQVKKFNPIKLGLGPQSTEKTKVLKRTCLTLDEIQEAFTSSHLTSTTETICSLPFSNDFRLQICVSEETLNISILKVVDSEFEAPNIMVGCKTVVEKNIQTLNNNSQVNSPVEILPSSNVESDSSQPDQGPSDSSSKNKNNIFPYLSQYFPDSEPVDQPCTEVNESHLNNSEVIPYLGSMESLNKNEDGNLCQLVEKASQNNISLPKDSGALSLLELSNKDVNIKVESNQGIDKISGAVEDKTDTDFPELNDSSDSLPPTLPYLGSNQSSKNNNKNRIADVIEPTCEVSEKNLSSSNNIMESTESNLDAKFEKPYTVVTTNPLSKREENDLLSDDEENINFDEMVSYQRPSITSPNNIEINDSDGLSSDPAMAFAAQLVAPMKNIAAKMNSIENNLNTKMKGKSSPEVINSREKRPLQEFEELVFNLSKNSANDTSVNKSSRLSLKSKRTAKKFKRIKKMDSDEDSDSAHSSKDELCATKDSPPKNKAENVQVAASSAKRNDLACESLQEQSTLNSFLSEDITSKDPNQLAMEVAVLDKEIYSVVEQLKQCGRGDVLKEMLAKLHTECEKESPVSEKSDKDQYMSDDSEDSTDIFSQSVPPTPPDNASSKSDSVFKSSHYKQN